MLCFNLALEEERRQQHAEDSSLAKASHPSSEERERW